jgi:hypothetical protein
MATYLVNSSTKYIGLSSDTKPTLTQADTGARFYESNTQSEYIWTGSAWSLLPPALYDAYYCRKTLTYTGAASYTIFNVTGAVAVKIIGFITTPLSNVVNTTSVGTTTDTTGILAATAGSAMQTVSQIWTDNAPSKFEAFPSTMNAISENVIVTGHANLVAGVVEFICLWKPISTGSLLVAA